MKPTVRTRNKERRCKEERRDNCDARRKGDSWNRCRAYGSIPENSAPLLPLQELRRWREIADLSRNRKGSVVMSSIFQVDLLFF